MKNLFTILLMLATIAGFSQKATNTWNGNDNTNWHDDDNWSLGHYPTSSEDVVIPTGMSRYPSVYLTDEEIKSLSIESDAFVRVGPRELVVSGDVYVFGEIIMYNSDAELHCQSIFWYSGSTAQTTGDCSYFISGNWKYVSGANVQLDDGYVFFVGSGSNYLISQDEDCYFNTIWVDKTGGVFGHSASSVTSCTIKESLFLYGSNYDFLSYDAETIKIGSALINGSSSINMTLNKGTIEFAGNPTSCMIRPQSGDYINNLTVNTGLYDMDMNTNNASVFEIKGDVSINSGRLDAGSMDLLVGGDWTNNVGPDGFTERDQKVTFNGYSEHQYCSNETFYTLEVDKYNGAFRVNGSDVICEEYDWTDGAVDVLSGSFTANELIDNGIAGSWYVNDEVQIYQSDGQVDLLGDIHIFDGGYMHVYGGNDDSYWPNGTGGSEIEIETGGSLKFHDVGINIHSAGTLTSNITGGEIKMVGDFRVDRADFYSSNTVWFMQGSLSTQVEISQGTIYQLNIDKDSAKDNSAISSGTLQTSNIKHSNKTIIEPSTKPQVQTPTKGIYNTGFTGRNGKIHSPTRNNTVSVAGEFNIYHFLVYRGAFDVNGKTANVSGSMRVYTQSTLKMTDPVSVLNVGNLEWRQGSSADITAGDIFINGDWTFLDMAWAQIGPGNTTHFVGANSQNINCHANYAAFGSVTINQTGTAVTLLNSSSTRPIQIAGGLNIKNSNIMQVETETLIVDGVLDIDNGGKLYLEHVGGELINNSNMNLTGEIEVNGGEAVIHGTFDIASTGELTIDGGSFGYDEGNGECSISGTLNMSNGEFTTDESIFIYPGATTNISGGTINTHSLSAEYENTFQPSGGLVKAQASNGGSTSLKMHSTNYLYDLEVDPINGVGCTLYSYIQVNNNVLVTSGRINFGGFTMTVENDVTIFGKLKMDNPDDKLIVGNDIVWKSGSTADDVTAGEIHVYGNWTFENGTEAQLGSGNIVRFTGNGSSNIYNYDSNASFGSMSVQKTSGSNTYINGGSTYPVHCTSGLSVESGNQFHIQHEDLIVDQGIFIDNLATMDMLGNGSLQNGVYMDVYGTLDIGDGEATVGGTFALHPTGTLNIVNGSLVCNPSANNTNMEIKGDFNLTGNGLFEITNNNIEFFSTANTNITAGTIRIGGHFFASHAGTFEPTGGKVEMSDGYVGGQIFCTNGNYFHDLETSANILVGDDITVNHNLNITSGQLNINSHTVEVGNNVNIYKKLIMTNSLDVLECGGWVNWMPGSMENITAGNIYTESWTFEDGTHAFLGAGNTAHIGAFCIVYDAGARFGNLILGADVKSVTDGKIDYMPIRTAGYCTIKSGLGLGSIQDYYIQGTMDIEDGATLSITEDNTLYVESDFVLNGKLDLNAFGNGYIHGDFEIASTGELIIEGGEFLVSDSNRDGTSYGSLTMTDGLFKVDGSLEIQSGAICNISGGVIRTTVFRAQNAGTFEPTGGTVDIKTSLFSGDGGISCENGNFLYNLTIDVSGWMNTYVGTDLLVINDFDIHSGELSLSGQTVTVESNTTIHNGGLKMNNAADVLNAGDDPSDEIIWKSDATLNLNDQGRINIFGDCTIENGVEYDIEADQTFAFIGTGDQNLYNYDDATFGVIELDKPSGALIIPVGSSVACQSYDWTHGTFTLNGGSFTALDLADAGLYGTNNFYSGEAHFYQDENQYADLNGDIILQNATVTIEGGSAGSYWGWTGDIDVTMSGGELNFIDNGINIGDETHSILSENISGGIIRTNGNFLGSRPDFTPGGGTVELFGSGLQEITLDEGQLFDLLISKMETDQGMPTIKNRIGDVITPVDITRINLQEDLTVTGTTTIESGQLTTMGFDMTCYDNVEINNGGTFIINPSSQLSMDNNEDINVNSGGMLELAGEAGNEVLLTHITGNYDVNINAGGTISGSHAIFEYMGSSGLNVGLDASIDPVSPLNNCTFRYGKAGGTLFTVNNDQTLSIDGAEFYTNGTENYNVKKVVNLGEITFTNYAGDFFGSAHEEDPYNRINWFEPELSVTPNNQNVSAAAGSTTFNIISTVDWQLTEAYDWLEVNPMTGTGDAVLTVSYDENMSTVSRLASITVSGDEVPDVSVIVIQAGANPILEVTPSNRDVSAAAGSTTFDLVSNTTWTVSEGLDWIIVTPANGSNNATLSVDYLENISGATRVGEITVFTPGLTNVTIMVSQESYTIQTITLPEGWSGLSSYIMPTNTDIETVFGGILGDLTIALTEETVFYPAYNINTIVSWQEQSAYKIKMTGTTNLEIIGNPDGNKTLDLTEGWNLIPAISECAVDVEELFAPVVADIEIVKDVAGYGLYWPDMGVNNLKNLIPGKAYYVLTSNAVSVTFGDCVKSTSGTLAGFDSARAGLSELSPWEIAKPTASSHSIALLADATQKFENGSILGAFNAKGNCFGLTALDGNANAITVFGDDELSTEKDGFVNEDQIIFKLYMSSTKEEIELIPEFDNRLPQYDGAFAEQGLSVITGFKTGSTGIVGQSLENIRVYPNPSNGTFNISGLQAGAEIKITDIHGQLVFSIQSTSGIQQLIDLQKCKPGIYMIGVSLHGNSSFHKMVVR